MPARVSDIVALGLEHGWSGFVPFYPQKKRAEIKRILDAFSLSALARRPFAEISPGERQRVLMARALVSRPRLLLLDEATSAMDVKNAGQTFRELAAYGAEYNCAVVAITHNFQAQLDAFSHLLIFTAGQFIMGRRAEVQENLAAVFA